MATRGDEWYFVASRVPVRADFQCIPLFNPPQHSRITPRLTLKLALARYLIGKSGRPLPSASRTASRPLLLVQFVVEYGGNASGRQSTILNDLRAGVRAFF